MSGPKTPLEERFQEWWQEEGKYCQDDEEALAWIAWSNGAYVQEEMTRKGWDSRSPKPVRPMPGGERGS